MEEKYPIKFSFGQFILLMSTGLILLVFVFFLGAKFGGGMFSPPRVQMVSHDLESLKPAKKEAPLNKLTSLQDLGGSFDEDEMDREDGLGAGAFGFYVDTGAEKKVSAKKPVSSPLEKTHTMVRIKSSQDDLYSLELDVFSDEDSAAQSLAQWKSRGYETYLSMEKLGQTQLYKVRLGNFGERKQAEVYSKRLREKEGIDVKIVRVEK